jgi:NADH:ubiquinone oxidoreductase subunit H
LSLIFILIRVAFITLLERKVLSYRQNRIGPNKVLFIGIIQPIIDGIKLLLKEENLITKTNISIFFVRPIIAFLIIIII